MIAHRQLVVVLVLHHRSDVAIDLARVGTLDAHPAELFVVGVLVVVDIDDLVVTEIQRVGAQREAAAIERGVEHLQRHRDPATGRTAGEDARPWLVDHAETRFDGRNQFLLDGIAIGPVVGRIHRVGIVVIGRGMLQRHHDHARRAVGQPVLVEVVVLAVETHRCAQREMTLVIHDRVVHMRMLVVATRQQHRRAKVDRLPPPPAQDRALELDVLHVARVGRLLHRWNHLVGHQPDRLAGARIEMHLDRLAIQVARRTLPVLSFPVIHVQPHRVPVGARKAGVDVDERLHPVIAGRQVRQAGDRRTKIAAVDHGRLAGLECMHVMAEQRHPGGRSLLDGWLVVGAADGHVHATGDRAGMGRVREADLDAWAVAGRGVHSRRCKRQDQASDQQRAQSTFHADSPW